MNFTDKKLKEFREKFAIKVVKTGDYLGYIPTTDKDELEKFLTDSINEAQRETIEHITNRILLYFLAWRKDLESKYEQGRKTKKSQLLLTFPEWLSENLERLEEKEE